MRSSLPMPRGTEWIDTDAALAEVLSVLDAVDEFAIDTEADSFYSYHVKVCLVQLSTRRRTFLIDPLAPIDLSPLGKSLADPEVTTVMHAGSNDIGLLRHRYGFEFGGTFDTMIAAQVLGLPRAGLGAILEERFEVAPEKSLQRSDWRQRPLTEKQLEYAALDTCHLLELKDQLIEELEDLGRLDEAEEEFELLEQTQTDSQRVWDPDAFRRIQGAKELDPVGLRILCELHRLRESTAEQADISPHRVLADRVLFEIAKRRPRSVEEAKRYRPLTHRRPGFLRRIVETVRDARNLGPVPKRARSKGRSSPDDGPLAPFQKRLFDDLRAWRVRRAEKRGVQESRIATTATLRALARRLPETHRALKEVPGMTRFRCKEYGDEILDYIDRALEEQEP